MGSNSFRKPRRRIAGVRRSAQPGSPVAAFPARGALLNSLFEHAPLGMQIFGVDGTAIRMNEANRRLLGLPDLYAADGKYNLLTDPFSQATGGDVLFRRALGGAIVRLPEFYVPLDDSSNSWDTRREQLFCDYWLFPIRDAAGTIFGVVACLLDVTRRKVAETELQRLNAQLEDLMALRTAQLEAAIAELESEVSERRQIEQTLRESEERFRAVIEASLDGFILLECVRDSQGLALDLRIIAINRQMELLLHRNGTSLLGRRLLADLPETTGARLVPIFLEVLASGQAMQREVSVPLERPSAGHYEMQVLKLGDGVAVSLRDVSIRVAAEAERLRVERSLLEAQRLESIGLLAGGVAHDFNNILTAVLGHAELAAADLPPESPAVESLAAVIQGAHAAAHLTKQLLAYAGRGRFVVGPVLLNQIIEELSSLLRASVTRRCTITFDLGRHLPPVQADGGQIRQLVLNLIVNAAEATGEAGGVILIETVYEELDRATLDGLHHGQALAAGAYVRLRVSDNGHGMDAELRARIFTPFFSTKGVGRGLGLAAVEGLVRSHAGALMVESEPAQGTRFSVWLPVALEWAAPALRRDLAPIRAAPLLKVLVVDDEEPIRRMLSQGLGAMGYQVLAAADGPAAITLARVEQPDLALVDLSMPLMQGDAVARALSEIVADLPIILMSGYSAEEISHQYAEIGLTGFLQKPFSLDQLRALLVRSQSPTH